MHDSVTVHQQSKFRTRKHYDQSSPPSESYGSACPGGVSLDVRHGARLAPIYGSAGQNLDKRNIGPGALGFVNRNRTVAGQSVSSRKDSICYLLGVANRDVRFIIPEDDIHRHFSSDLFYWLFNQPIKFRGTSLTLFAPNDYALRQPLLGLELHEVLNLTNDMTLQHLRRYPYLPPGPENLPPFALLRAK